MREQTIKKGSMMGKLPSGKRNPYWDRDLDLIVLTKKLLQPKRITGVFLYKVT